MSDEKKDYQTKYATFKLPRDFTEIIDWIVENSDLKFASRISVLKHAVRELYKEELKKKK
ncbi:hypothetical protein [Candidatus Lokiarchaeum ossiferum]|uniref:hypothetical protein n=1 Tax=Candidatus Lokiarchaeum ossiferum TaxID=2951803 RepID=UPI00352DEA17